MSDIVISYENSMQLLVTVQVCTGMHSRGCTGFDGGFEVKEAIGVQVCAHLTACYTVGYSNAGFDFQLDYGATEPMLASDYSDTTVTA